MGAGDAPSVTGLNYVLHRLLSDAAAAEPNREAVRCAGRGITYRELDAAANGLTDYFDFTNAALLNPPALPAAPIDPAHAAQCLTAPPNGAF